MYLKEDLQMMNSASFEKAIPYILANEGGYVDDPNDLGGATNYGISLRFLKSINLDINNDGVIYKEDIKELTPEQASNIYLKYFWTPNRYGELKEQRVATKIFDFCVHKGAGGANKSLQQATNMALKKDLLKIDGICGSFTINAVNSISDTDLLEDLLCHCITDKYIN